MLTFTIRSTASLLGIGALLVVLGSFDTALGWDIFGPQLEAALYGVFFSSVGLAAIGVALCFVLGIHELVTLMRASQLSESLPPQRPPRFYWIRAGVVFVCVWALIVALELGDRRVQAHRQSVFHGIAKEQIDKLAPKLAAVLPEEPPASTEGLDALMRTIENLDFVSHAALFVADGVDPDALWRYSRSDGDDGVGRFERIFAVKPFEIAITSALHGRRGGIDEANERPSFTWVTLIGESAVLVIRGNENENFRLYSGGS